MKPPIIIDDQCDFSMFERVEEAEKDVEPIDLARTDLVIYDSEGRLLRGRVVKTGFLSRRIKLEPAESEPQHSSVLRERLIRFLAKLGDPRDSLEMDSLDGLIARGIGLLTPPKKWKV